MFTMNDYLAREVEMCIAARKMDRTRTLTQAQTLFSANTWKLATNRLAKSGF